VLRLLDDLLRDHLLDRMPAITSAAQIRFAPPDAILRADVSNLNQMVLDVYLADLRENRKLRSNAHTRVADNGVSGGDTLLDFAPARVDCHYLLSAWSPLQPGSGVDAAVEEHALLYEAISALIQYAPLSPARVYAAAPLKLAPWGEFGTDQFPTAVLPAEGFAKLGDFWSSMGATMPWKPVVYLVVTIPVALLQQAAGVPVTAALADLRVRDTPNTAELTLDFGGWVRDVSGTAIENAWVVLETPAGAPLSRTRTDAFGRFTFTRLRPGQYRLRASAVPFTPLDVPVVVPSATGEYELQLS
jgi:hypothetical protein